MVDAITRPVSAIEPNCHFGQLGGDLASISDGCWHYLALLGVDSGYSLVRIPE